MKKLMFVLVLFMAVLAVNAQAIKSPDSNTPVTKVAAVRAPVMVADLLKPITDNVAKDFAGYTIKEATSVTENSTVTYEVVVIKGTATETLVYDKEGSFVKKLLTAPETKLLPAPETEKK
jgi:hypothetical protein